MSQGKALVALGSDVLVVFPVPSSHSEDTQLLTINLRTKAQKRTALPDHLVSAHTKIQCQGNEVFIFYCPLEQADDVEDEDEDETDSDSDSGTDSDTDNAANRRPLLHGRKLTAYKLTVCTRHSPLIVARSARRKSEISVKEFPLLCCRWCCWQFFFVAAAGWWILQVARHPKYLRLLPTCKRAPHIHQIWVWDGGPRHCKVVCIPHCGCKVAASV